MKKFLLFFIQFSGVLLSVYSQTKLTYSGSDSYILVERTDLRRYDNGKYTGLVSREVRSFIYPTKQANNKSAYNNNKSNYTDTKFYEGNFYINEKTRRNSISVKKPLNEAIPSSFEILQNGDMIMKEDNGYPSFRSFPAYPKNEITYGDKWQSTAYRSVDPLNKGVFTKMPIFVEYTYLKDSTFYGEDVFVLSAKWATRYGSSYKDSDGDKDLVSAIGSHSATMNISFKTGNALVVRDSVDETFTYADGNKVNFKGTISLFTEYPPFVDKDKIIPAIKNSKDLDESNGVKVTQTDAGLMLTLQNLQFKSDSDILLQGQEKLLDSIAKVLKEVPTSQFLVEGHTAFTGNEKGEMQLSLQRAKTVATELSNRGVNIENFICKGSGSHKPVADNLTPEGKALNRRVEITILY